MTGRSPLLTCSDIGKAFGAAPVLSGVAFQLEAGRALGLVGENGAGKSTLMNILGGNLRADTGAMRLDGAPYAPRDPTEAGRRGIAFIHQELNLFGNLTIAENLFLTRFPTTPFAPLIRRRAMGRAAVELLRQVGLARPPHTLVDELSAGERQLVEVAKALSGEARLIIFDEPTTSLTHPEIERLLALIGSLKARGIAVIYISHQLDEVFRVCDDILVLRDGRVAGAGASRDFDHARLITLMVGRAVSQLFPARETARRDGQPLLEVRGVSQPRVARDVSFTLRRGEILGLAGLMGAGRSELARILFGLDPFAAGEIRIDGRPLRPAPRQSIRHGLAFITESRRDDGLCPAAAIADNVALVTLPAHAARHTGWLRLPDILRSVEKARGAVRLTETASLRQPVHTLSGGNQQKVVLAKWLLARPRVLILDEPTRGIDVGARSEIYQLVVEQAAAGAGVLVISSDLEELLGLCDRILVMRRGEIQGEFPRESFDREAIMAASFGPAAASGKTILPS